MSTIENLPDELIIHLLQFLSDKTIKNTMILVNKRFFNIISNEYLNTLYGKALRLDAWQKPHFNRFNKAIDTLHNNYQITLFHKPQAAGIERFMQGALNKVYLPILAILVLWKLYHIVISLLPRSDVTLTIKMISSIGVVLSFSLRLLQEYYQANRMNIAFNRELLRNLPVSEQEKITQFKEQFKFLLEDINAPLNHMDMADITVGNFKEILKDTKKKINTIREQAIIELQQASRFKSISYLPSEKISQEYESYLRTVNTRWSAENIENSLFEFKENDEYVPVINAPNFNI